MKKKITAFSIVASMFLSSAALATTPFKDISDHWGKKEIEWGYSMGIAKGVSEDEFAPEQEITRAMFITMLYRLEGSPKYTEKSNFKDVSENDYYYDAVNWAFENKITAGVSEDYFGSTSNIKREDIVTLLHRKENKKPIMELQKSIEKFSDAEDISDYAKEAMSWALDNEVVFGYNNTELKPKANASRAQAVAILLRYSDLNKEFEPFNYDMKDIYKVTVRNGNDGSEIVVDDEDKIEEIIDRLNSFKISNSEEYEPNEGWTYLISVETKDSSRPTIYSPKGDNFVEIGNYAYYTESKDYISKNWDDILKPLFKQ